MAHRLRADLVVTSDLVALLLSAVPASEEELHEQRISFAFGNALDNPLVTKESARRASKNVRLALDA